MTEDPTLELPFDQYQRYRLVADLIERVRPSGRALRILDVGGRTALLRSFLPEDRVDLVDVDPSAVEGLVLGSGAALPFADGAFDVVAAFDTLEHVPVELREPFVRECARVSSRHVILAGPYRSPEVDEAEDLLVAFLRDKLGTTHRYLQEHRDHGLPVREDVESWLADSGRVASIGHASLERWLPLMCLELYLVQEPILAEVARRFFRFYNGQMYASDHAAPVYRHAVVLAKGRAKLPDTEGLFAPARAPEGATEALVALGAEVLRFDAEVDAVRPELDRLHGVVRGLEADLAGHRARLKDTELDLAEHRGTLTEERADRAREQREVEQVLHELREQLGATGEERDHLAVDLDKALAAARESAEQNEELLARRTALESSLEARALEVESLTADLEEHRASLATLGEEHARLETELREEAQRRGKVEADLEAGRNRVAEVEDLLSEATRDRAALRETIDTLEADLEHARKAFQDAAVAQTANEARLAALEAEIVAHEGVAADLRQQLERVQTAFSEAATAQEAASSEAEALKHQRAEVAAQLAAVEEDLAGHRATLSEVQRLRAEERESFESAVQELHASLEEREVRLGLGEQAREALERSLEELQQRADEERAAAQARHDELDGAREAAEEHRALLLKELESAHEGARGLAEDLHKARVEAQQLAEVVAERDARIAGLVQRLRSRVESFKRVLRKPRDL